MRISLSALRSAAVLAGVTAGLAGLPSASAVSAPAARVTGAPISSLPFYGSGEVTGVGTGTPGTAASNAEVARVCNGGDPIQKSQWYTLPAVSLGSVVARADAPYHPRGIDQNPSGTAFVDVSSGKVLACGTAPVNVTAERRVAVMAYYAQSVAHCDADAMCSHGSLRLYVNTTATSPSRNDHWDRATTISSLPFTGSVDSSAADDDGPAVFDYEHCERSAIDPQQHGTVWWRYTPTRTGPVPALAVDVRSPWNRLGIMDGFDGFSPRIAVAELTASGPVPAPHQDPDDCESPVLLRAGQTYVIAVYVFEDGYENSTPVTGGPLTLRVGSVAKPRVPQGLSVTVNRPARQATVQWSAAPAAVGASPVTGYVVRVDRRTSRGTWVRTSMTRLPASARSRTVGGLTSSSAYRVRVAATNRAGTGLSAFEVLSPR